MITNAVRESWPGDVPIPAAEEIGLLIPSKVRTAKIAAVETAAAERIARLDAATMQQVAALLRSYLFR
jgi:mRNA-degrading endonuclease toxin of MazEF toxin-antitoxin module